MADSEDVRRSRALAAVEILSESSVAATTGALTGGPLGAVLGAVSPAVARGIQILARRVAETEQEAVRVSGLDRSELAERLLEDEAKFSVAQQVFSGAQAAATAEKRLYLGRLLGNTVHVSDVDVDEMLIYAQVLIELEEPHLQVLALLERAEGEEGLADPRTGGVSIATIAEHLPGVWLYWNPVLTRLQGHGLLEDAGVGTWGGMTNPGQSWKLSEFGTNFLRMLRETDDDVTRE